MKLNDCIKVLKADVLVPGADMDMDIRVACGADLMSDVMAFACHTNEMMLTGLVNQQTIRTAEMMDVKVVVFVRNGSSWVQQAVLTVSSGSTQDRFGSAVAVHGNTIVASAPALSAAHVFERTGTVWTPAGVLSGGAGAREFDQNVGVAGSTLWSPTTGWWCTTWPTTRAASSRP